MNQKSDVPSNQFEYIKRCNQCYKIPLIKSQLQFNKKDNIFYINYNCENGHTGEINLEDYLNNNNNLITKIDCFECKKKQENDYLNFYYCISCKQILCNNCIYNHSFSLHRIIAFSRFDSTCLEHSQSFTNYCKHCNKNICDECLNAHQNHYKISLSQIIISDQKLEEIIKYRNDIIKIKQIKDEIIEELGNEKQIKKINDIYYGQLNLLYSFCNNLLNIYNSEKQLDNYNYEIIENLKIFEKNDFLFEEPFPSFTPCNNIYEKSEIFISYYKQKFNIIDNNISNILNYHLDTVNQIILLKDGRIASCSNDKSIIMF